MTMIHTSPPSAVRVGNPVQIVVMNAVITLGLIALLKAQGFGWGLALVLGSFSGAALTVIAVSIAVTMASPARPRNAMPGS